MNLILVRHGESDYPSAAARGFIGQGQDLRPLTAKGIEQAHMASGDPRLKKAQLIVSSPYTRAMQTAAILSKNLGIDLAVEIDLHEWLPDTSFLYNSVAYEHISLKEFVQNVGLQKDGTQHPYEECAHVAKRAFEALYSYADTYDCIAVVSHGVMMRQFVPAAVIPYCGILELEFDRSFQWPGFVAEAYAPFLSL